MAGIFPNGPSSTEEMLSAGGLRGYEPDVSGPGYSWESDYLTPGYDRMEYHTTGLPSDPVDNSWLKDYTFGSSSDMDEYNKSVGKDTRIGVMPTKSGGTGGGFEPRRKTTMPIMPMMPPPSAPEPSTFTAPERDPERIKLLTQQKSAGGMRAMRAQIAKAMGQSYRNPNIKRITLRDALAGYGQGIENVMGGAQTQAESAYEREYSTKYETAGKNWQAQNQAKMMDWQAKINNYYRMYGEETTLA